MKASLLTAGLAVMGLLSYGAYEWQQERARQAMSGALTPVRYNKHDIADLEQTNRLLMKNVEPLMRAARNHSSIAHAVDDPKRTEYFYSMQPWMLFKYLPARETHDAAFLRRHYAKGKTKSLRFTILNINFRPASSVFSYEVKYAFVDDHSIKHSIWHKRPEQRSKHTKKVIKIDDDWTYVIEVEEYRGR
ncbi:MAG: hypothetical protein JRH20_20295 [Deltaproteobacteria bacterium]|nr:hypothetical protein [Deltaproteobacteria bacterium]